MGTIVVQGGRALNGKITLQGAKNSALPILAATVLCKGVCILHNCPQLSDVQVCCKILRHLGAKVTENRQKITVDATEITRFDIPDSLMREMRSSIVFLGAIIGRMGRAVLSTPGGCKLGPRPIDLHLSSLSELGVTVAENHGNLICNCQNGVKGNNITLAFPSVGATENVVLASVCGRGVTRLNNPAREPEIVDLCNFLNNCGAHIVGAGTDLIEISGTPSLQGCQYTIMPDRIAAATYLAAVAATGGSVTLYRAKPMHLLPILSVFEKAGCTVQTTTNSISLQAKRRLGYLPMIRTLPYPGFPTDAGPPLIAMFCLAAGSTMFVENIFENRYNFIDELRRFGATIRVNDRVAVIDGNKKLFAATADCTDLRGGAALLIAALAANGCSVIRKTQYIHRGYDHIVKNLQKLGAEIYEKDD